MSYTAWTNKSTSDTIAAADVNQLAVNTDYSQVSYKSTSHTITSTELTGVYLVTSTGGDITITLPAISTATYHNRYKIIHVRNTSTETLTISCAGADTITQDALTSLILPKPGNYLELYVSSDTLSYEILSEAIDCMLRLDTYAGYGSVDTKVMRFTNKRDGYGNCFTENHTSGYNSTTEGLKITIAKSGKYGFSFTSNTAVFAFGYWGISINSTQLTTNIQSINAQNRLADDYRATGTIPGCVSVQMQLSAGDIVRPHTNGGIPGDAAQVNFIATYVG